MPRNRSVRAATIGPARPRLVSSSAPPPRSARTLRRRVVVVALVVASLALLTVYFRESSGGTLHDVQSTGATILRPFEIAATRIAQPFEDAAGWFGDLLDAKSESAKLRRENQALRARLVQLEWEHEQNAILRHQLHYVESTSFPGNYRYVATDVISQPTGRFDQQVTIAAGSDNGIRQYDAVVTGDGLAGEVTKVARKTAQVTLIDDESIAVSAEDLKTGASGLVKMQGSQMILDGVTPDKVVKVGDLVITSGWRSGKLASIYPRWLRIGRVTSVSQSDIGPYKTIQLKPFVDFSELRSVLVLVPKARR